MIGDILVRNLTGTQNTIKAVRTNDTMSIEYSERRTRNVEFGCPHRPREGIFDWSG